VRFEVLDCTVDGFVHKGRAIVVSARLARLPAAQRFFILAHELGHLRLQHHAAMMSFVARAVDSSADEAAARAAVASGLSTISHRNELEADAFAVRLMRAAGLDPEEAARLFDSIGEGADNATHPSAGRRARAIRDLL
jgi:predicted Zn-dependent protease